MKTLIDGIYANAVPCKSANLKLQMQLTSFILIFKIFHIFFIVEEKINKKFISLIIIDK